MPTEQEPGANYPVPTYKEIAESLIAGVMEQVEAELRRAMSKHRPMYSCHEGISVIKEEVEELWDHVMVDTGHTWPAKDEAIQIAAMGARYAIDLVYGAKAGYKF